MTKNYHIQISQDIKSAKTIELFSLLEQLWPIKFLFGEQNAIEVNGAIIKESGFNSYVPVTSSYSLSLTGNFVNKSRKVETQVEFSDDPNVPFPFRGRRINTKMIEVEMPLILSNNDKILASNEQGPIWSISEIDGIKCFRSALALPYISIDQNFNDVFNGECFLEMLVLLHFMSVISINTEYQHAPLRASFIIDDPNLHWPRYGFVDYCEIAANAKKKNYHVSFATIPLDTWFTHTATADLFRTNSRWISLLIHGNNHAKEELAQNYSAAMRKGLLQQAIQRIKRMEQKSNISVCRVMVPPHGACSDEMLEELSNSEFESACISAGSLRAHNKDKLWTKILGFFPAEIIHGFPVLPRWGLTGNIKNSLLLAAYLGQPMILRGHHQDLKDGGEIFDEYAKFINGLGNVFWSNMTDLSKLNYLWRSEGTICYIKPFGRKIVFQLPNETTEVVLESFDSVKADRWKMVTTDGRVYEIIPGKPFFLTTLMSREIRLVWAELSQPLSLKTVNTPTKSILRRLLTEARDRLLWH